MHKYQVTVKYSRHPYIEDGSQDYLNTENASWFTTIRAEDALSAKKLGLAQFNSPRRPFIRIKNTEVKRQSGD